MSSVGPVVACAAYAGLLWLFALAIDAIGRRSLRRRHDAAHEETAIGPDVATFHRVVAGAILAVGAFVPAAYAVARRDAPALLLFPIAALCLAGAVRRVALLWREP